MKKMDGRRALSPLIATVLLIAFAVALGTMIMNWSIGSGDRCADLDVLFTRTPAGPAVCVDPVARHLKFDVTNQGTEEVTYLSIQATDEQGNYQGKKLPLSLAPGASASNSIQLITSQPTNIDIELVSGFEEEGSLELCEGQSITLQQVPLC